MWDNFYVHESSKLESISSFQRFYESKFNLLHFAQKIEPNRDSHWNYLLLLPAYPFNFSVVSVVGGWAFRKVHGLLRHCSSKRRIIGCSQLYLTEDSINKHSSRRPLSCGCNWCELLTCSSCWKTSIYNAFLLLKFSSLHYWGIFGHIEFIDWKLLFSPHLSQHTPQLYFLTDWKRKL